VCVPVVVAYSSSKTPSFIRFFVIARTSANKPAAHIQIVDVLERYVFGVKSGLLYF